MRRETALAAAIAAFIMITTIEPAFAGGGCDSGAIQNGDFAAAAKCIVGAIATGFFGAAATAVTAALAIVAAITGSYRGAWAVLFVSIGLFILEPLCKLLFNGTF